MYEVSGLGISDTLVECRQHAKALRRVLQR